MSEMPFIMAMPMKVFCLVAVCASAYFSETSDGKNGRISAALPAPFSKYLRVYGFHCIGWSPLLLRLQLSDLPVPERLAAHGFLEHRHQASAALHEAETHALE